MGKFVAAVVAGVLATVIGGLILNSMKGRRPGRGDVPGTERVLASLPLEYAAPLRLRPLSRA
jgi:hypothetical protein